jgi:hypothetical protein
VTPSRAASDARLVSVSAPSSIRLAAARASLAAASTLASPGASSGRQRRHGRKPARSAAAALGKKLQFSRFGSGAVHTGRQ